MMKYKKSQTLIMASSVLAATFGVLLFRMSYGGHFSIFLDLSLVLGVIFGLILLDIYRLKPSSSHTWFSLLVQYLVQRVLYASVGLLCRWRLNTMSKSCQHQQKEFLMEILKTNSKTRLGSHFNVSEIESVREFVKTVPLTTYEHYKPFFEEVAEKGSPDVLFPGPADYIAMTSGTSSGKSKMFPKSLSIMRRKTSLWWLFLQRKQLDIKDNHLLRKILGVRVYPKFTFSKSGIKQGAISGISADAKSPFFVTPFRGGNISTEPEALYINLLFAISETELGNMFFSTSTLALTFLKTLETKWRQLCDDLERGRVSKSIAIEDKWRTLFDLHLEGGHPARARALRAEFEKGFERIVPRIWPTCPAVFCIATGPFRLQANILKDLYLGDVPIISQFHAGSETTYGINIDPGMLDNQYTALTPVNFFEFIPEENVNEKAPSTLLAHQVEEGKVYEIVVTTWEGLYRYRTDDLVRIEGFLGQIPKYSFFQRSGDMLTAHTEKVPESLVSSALVAAAGHWSSKTIGNYTSVENTHVEHVKGEVSGQYHYIVFLELLEDEAILTNQECSLVDGELSKLHDRYASFRAEHKLNSIQICQVKIGTFLKIRDLVLASNPYASCMQYKLPRIIRRPELLRTLIDNIITPRT